MRCTDLQNQPLVHYRDAIRNRKRFLLVMGNINESNTNFVMNRIQLDKHVLAQFGVQRGKGFVQEKDARFVYQGPGNRHPLFLAAGKLIRLFVGMAFKLDKLEIVVYKGADFIFRRFFKAHGKSDVLENRQMRKKRVILENRIGRTFVGRHRQDVFAVKGYFAFIGTFKSRKDSKEGGFSATRRPQKGKKFALIDDKINVFQRGKIAESFGNPFYAYIATNQLSKSQPP